MGEGGALLIRDREHVERAEIIREKGTDRSKYFRGQVDKYRWQEVGSIYVPSELKVASLYAQLEMADQINEARLARWNEYYKPVSYTHLDVYKRQMQDNAAVFSCHDGKLCAVDMHGTCQDVEGNILPVVRCAETF